MKKRSKIEKFIGNYLHIISGKNNEHYFDDGKDDSNEKIWILPYISENTEY